MKQYFNERYKYIQYNCKNNSKFGYDVLWNTEGEQDGIWEGHVWNLKSNDLLPKLLDRIYIF